MLTYTNQLPGLKLPEYGRNIHRMLEYCLSIEDREKRTACARSIVDAMNILFPAGGDNPAEHMQKLWDHLFIMSDFALDVDVPYNNVQTHLLDEKPEPLEMPRPSYMPMRRYGSTIVRMIDVASTMLPGESRDELIFMIADHMKKIIVAFCRESVDDARVFDDLRRLSGGAIDIRPGQMMLHEFRALPAPSKKKRRK